MQHSLGRTFARSRTRRTRGGPCSRGFTLLETMVALAILAVGVLGVAVVLITALKHLSQSRSLTQAHYLAQQQIETMHAMTPTDVLALRGGAGYPNDPANPIDPDPADTDLTVYNRRWTIESDTPEVGVMRVTVQVDWTDPKGVVRTTALQTLKAGS